MVDLPVESRYKYGRMDDWEEASDEFATALAGGDRGNGSGARRTNVATSPADDEVDAEFLRQAGRPDAHYGR